MINIKEFISISVIIILEQVLGHIEMLASSGAPLFNHLSIDGAEIVS